MIQVLRYKFTALSRTLAITLALVLFPSISNAAVEPLILENATSIDLPARPWDILLSPDGTKAYTLNADDFSISVLDLVTETVTANIPIGEGVYHPGVWGALAITSDATKIVLPSLPNSLVIIDLVEETISAKIEVGIAPTGVAISPDNLRAYTANYQDSSVSVVDLDSNSEIERIPLTSEPLSIAITRDGEFALVTLMNENHVVVIDLATNLVVRTIEVGPEPFKIFVNPKQNNALISSISSGGLWYLDLETYVATPSAIFAVTSVAYSADGKSAFLTAPETQFMYRLDLQTLNFSSFPILVGEIAIGVALLPGESRVALTKPNEKRVYLIDIDELSEVKVISTVQGSYNIGLSEDDSLLYVTSFYESQNSLVNLDENSVSEINVPNRTFGVAISKDNSRAYVTAPDSNQLIVVDLSLKEVIDSITLGNYPYGVVLSANEETAYVTNSGDGTISVVDLLEMVETATIPVGMEPAAIAISPNFGKLFVIGLYDQSTLFTIDLATNEVIATTVIDGETGFVDVSADGTKLYIALLSGGIMVVDVATSTVLEKIVLDTGTATIAIGQNNNRAYVTNILDGNALIVDLNTGEELRKFTVPETIGIALNSQESALYLASVEGILYLYYLANAKFSSEPASWYSGEPFVVSPVIRIEDNISGNLVNYNGLVTTSISSGVGVLGGTTTVRAVNGIASFPNLRITGIGDFVLKFSPKDVKPIFSKTLRLVEPPLQILNYRANYRANGSDVSKLPAETNPLVFGETYKLSTQVPIRTGYTFEVWNTSANGTGKNYLPGDVVTSGATELTLYAIWKINSYSLALNSNTNNPSTIATLTRDFNTAISIPSIAEDKLPIGYEFVSWNTKQDGSGKNYLTGDSFNMGATDQTLYAQWKVKSFNISYDGNGNKTGRVPLATTEKFNAQITVLTPPRKLTKSGYTFDGWNIAKDGSGTDYKVGETFSMVGSNITLYAKWIPNKYRVTFRTVTTAPMEAGEFSTGGSISSAPTPAPRKGFVFKGWSNSPSKNNILTFPYSPGVARNITLYAVWEKVKR